MRIRTLLQITAPLTRVANVPRVSGAWLENAHLLISKACWTKIGNASIAIGRATLAIYKLSIKRLDPLIFVGLVAKIDRVTQFAIQRLNAINEARLLLYLRKSSSARVEQHFGKLDDTSSEGILVVALAELIDKVPRVLEGSDDSGSFANGHIPPSLDASDTPSVARLGSGVMPFPS